LIPVSCGVPSVIPEIDIWRAATLRADEFAAQDDYHGQATWRRITDPSASWPT
jgi:hypothetical protein